jgi:hypothetical protein
LFGGERKTTLTATAAKKEWRVAPPMGSVDKKQTAVRTI